MRLDDTLRVYWVFSRFHFWEDLRHLDVATAISGRGKVKGCMHNMGAW